MKYIIKNCPVFNHKHNICNKKSKVVYCKDISDCLLKRIIEKYKKAKEKYYELNIHEEDYIFFSIKGAYDFATEILDMLEIEEVEE